MDRDVELRRDTPQLRCRVMAGGRTGPGVQDGGPDSGFPTEWSSVSDVDATMDALPTARAQLRFEEFVGQAGRHDLVARHRSSLSDKVVSKRSREFLTHPFTMRHAHAQVALADAAGG